MSYGVNRKARFPGLITGSVIILFLYAMTLITILVPRY
jgi:hypothetical protein